MLKENIMLEEFINNVAYIERVELYTPKADGCLVSWDIRKTSKGYEITEKVNREAFSIRKGDLDIERYKHKLYHNGDMNCIDYLIEDKKIDSTVFYMDDKESLRHVEYAIIANGFESLLTLSNKDKKDKYYYDIINGSYEPFSSNDNMCWYSKLWANKFSSSGVYGIRYRKYRDIILNSIPIKTVHSYRIENNVNRYLESRITSLVPVYGSDINVLATNIRSRFESVKKTTMEINMCGNMLDSIVVREKLSTKGQNRLVNNMKYRLIGL